MCSISTYLQFYQANWEGCYSEISRGWFVQLSVIEKGMWMLSGFVLWEGIFIHSELVVLLVRWGEYCDFWGHPSVCHLSLFTEEEEENTPEKVEEQRKMSQDSVHPTTGNDWCGFLGKLLLVWFTFPSVTFLRLERCLHNSPKLAGSIWISYGR